MPIGEMQARVRNAGGKVENQRQKCKINSVVIKVITSGKSRSVIHNFYARFTQNGKKKKIVQKYKL